MPNSSPGEVLRPTEAARLQLSRRCADPQGTLTDAFRAACEISAETLNVERVGVWMFIENRCCIRCVDLYERSKKEHSEGTRLCVADFPRYFSSLNLRKYVPAEFAHNDPRTAELADSYLKPLGITSMLDAAIVHNGEIVGIVCHEHVGPPREWTTEQRDFASSVADAISLKMVSAQLHELHEAMRTQEGRLVALEKSDALAQMAAGIAHDFNNLLAIISAHAELLHTRKELASDVRVQIKEIAEASIRGTALVKGLLEFAKPNGNTPIALNLSDAAANFMPMLRAAVGSSFDIQFERPPAVGHVLIDRTQFTRILLNLVVNARDAMPDGGPIRIRIAPIKASENGGLASHFVLVEVIDQGSGMDEATQQRIFEPFFSTKAKGTGLGMAIVRRIVDHAGGFIRIESAKGAGAKIQLFFPRVGGSSGATSEYPVPPELLKLRSES